MFYKIELKCDTFILGSLYITITYNVLCVLSLKSVVIKTSEFVIVIFWSMTHFHYKMP
jgi:hypothetical protein